MLPTVHPTRPIAPPCLPFGPPHPHLVTHHTCPTPIHTVKTRGAGTRDVHCRSGGFGSGGGGSNKPSTSTSSNKASGSTPPSGQTTGTNSATIPESRDEAIAQAAASIRYHLTAHSPTSKSKPKSKLALGMSTDKKLSVEVPVMDPSPAAAVALAQELIAALPSELGRQFTVVACGSKAGQGRVGDVIGLERCVAEGRGLTGCVIVAGPTKAELGTLERCMADWRGPVAVLLNPEWASELAEDTFDPAIPPQLVAFARTFTAAYCFFPIAIKAFVVTTQEGLVLRQVGAGGEKAPWRIFMRQGGAWEAVGRMAKRPSMADIEVSFYNASAATSPLTAGAKFLKGLVSKKKS